MSRFFSKKYENLTPYTPGEQPQDMQYIKLNTNESPFPPHPAVAEAVKQEVESLRLYSDPDCKALVAKLAKQYGVAPEQVMLTNGSDDVLNFAFMAFCDEEHPAVFPDITYGFYKVFAEINHIPYAQIPLKEDFSVDVADYCGVNKTVFIANPNAPTGIALSLDEIEKILKSNPNNVVVIDEAYVDFGAQSAVALVEKYENLLVVQTFSKSRSMAGARLGFAIGNKNLMADLNTLRYSTNPYNINRMTSVAGIVTLENQAYTDKNCGIIMENRENAAKALKKLGFALTDSKSNFLFASHPAIDGKTLYTELKRRGILVRHFDKPRISPYVRITVGTAEQMDALIRTIGEILEENQ
ncbi:MAG: histidinol-phosphate transaminase [Oscillospiraceae bacterium]|nr:histidinol-phosphate transaminase [Oscillospiraceae bacterium]